MTIPSLKNLRKEYQPKLPQILQNIESLQVQLSPKETYRHNDQISKWFSKTGEQSTLQFILKERSQHQALRVGVVFSGGPAAGGHNVIIGLYDSLKKLNSNSQLFGFLNGPSGIVSGKYIELDKQKLNEFQNQGGFDLIGSGRTKIETIEQFQAAEQTVTQLKLDGLVVIGGDDSNTNAALLAEYFLARHISTRVVGVPKTIDGDLKNDYIETSFGFDTATKTFSESIGNILKDCLSQKKYYFFIKLMGRSASHVALECALQTHPNLTLIGEEIANRNLTLQAITNQIADVICARAAKGKNYGVILIPEGVVEFIPEMNKLIKELNAFPPNSLNLMNTVTVFEILSDDAKRCFNSIPKDIQVQLLLDRDPHGNVRVSQIDIERLFIETVGIELEKRANAHSYSGKFSAQPHFCGYEGRSGFPSNFDSQYCYSLGFVATLLINAGFTGYMSCVHNLTHPIEEWKIAGVPLTTMIHLEERHNKIKPVIKKALVDLEGKIFLLFKEKREFWSLNDDFLFPGPIQFFGPPELTDRVTLTLELESQSKKIPINL